MYESIGDEKALNLVDYAVKYELHKLTFNNSTREVKPQG